jgi:hypothetical protein
MNPTGNAASSISVFIPIETRSEANIREHWAEHARRAKRQRDAAMVIVRCALARNPAGALMKKAETKLTVTLIRAGSRRLDSDNLQRALKAVRDGVADALTRDDGDPEIEWMCGQAGTRECGVGVAVTIEVRE